MFFYNNSMQGALMKIISLTACHLWWCRVEGLLKERKFWEGKGWLGILGTVCPGVTERPAGEVQGSPSIGLSRSDPPRSWWADAFTTKTLTNLTLQTPETASKSSDVVIHLVWAYVIYYHSSWWKLLTPVKWDSCTVSTFF